VYDQLSEKSGKEEIIDLLLEHAEKHMVIEMLLTIVKKQNPTRYDRHQPYLQALPTAYISRQPTEKRRYFAVGTALYPEVSSEARLLSSAVIWLLAQRNVDSMWGGIESLDKFITTNHVVMALTAVGVPPNSSILRAAITYLVNIDKDKVVSFFWRAGPLLNLPEYNTLVKDDMEFLWRFRKRIGAHKDYPVPFFLLKLTRFIDPKPDLSFGATDVLEWVLDEWNEQECWYGRTSISSMALALLYDLEFENKVKIIGRTVQFLEESFTDLGNNTGTFSGHLVDDCFTVFNLCETDFFNVHSGSLLKMVEKTVRWITTQCINENHWEGPPPFGGDIGQEMYPTAVAIRALLSYYIRVYPAFLNQMASMLIEHGLTFDKQAPNTSRQRRPFWGESHCQEEDICFVLMPFKPAKLTEIYERYIKAPIENQTTLRCVRADDIYRPSEIMRDIWDYLHRAKVIVADLTDKNPNVFYELGMAHVLGKYVILVSQRGEDIPFDLRGVRTIIYEDRISGYEYLAQQVLRFLNSLSDSFS
jgi:hypothetical protein